jgi:hypothetical protein
MTVSKAELDALGNEFKAIRRRIAELEAKAASRLSEMLTKKLGRAPSGEELAAYRKELEER